MANEEFGKRVKSVRTNAGLSQEALGQMAGLRQNTIAKVESGLVNAPLSNAISIAKALGVSMDYLCGWTDEDIHAAARKAGRNHGTLRNALQNALRELDGE